MNNKNPGFTLKAEGKDLTLDIFDSIGEDLFGSGVSAKSVSEALKPHKNAKSISVNINSPGGYAFDGITIYNLLAKHKAPVTVNIDGIAASAASIIAMAGDEINMAENAMMMIHNASAIVWGGADDMRAKADMMDKLDGQLAQTYAARTGGDLETITEQMDDETWFTAEEAVADGFATSVTPAKRVAASYDPAIFSLFKNAPEQLRAITKPTPKPVDDTADQPSNGDDDMKTEITAEAFAQSNPDAIKNWKAEGAIDAAKDDKARCEALRAEFADDPAFALDQVIAGHDLPKAKAEFADVLKAKNEELAKKNAELSKQLDEAEDGADPVTLSAGDEPKDKYEGLSVKDRIAAEWDDNHENCQKKYSVPSAYAAYRMSRLGE